MKTINQKENKIYMLIKLSLLSLILLALWVNVSAQNKALIAKEKQTAEQAWEALVKVKGGREKLHSVQNILREMDYGNKKIPEGVRLWVFPNKEWKFSIFMDDSYLTIWNGAKSVYQYINKDGTVKTEPDKKPDKWFYRKWAIHMLETKWFKPKVLSIRRIKRKKRTFDVIATSIQGLRVDYLFGPEQMLVQEVDIYYQGKIVTKHSFRKYVEVDGIKMPTLQGQASFGNLRSEKLKIYHSPVRFSFNVEYDPELFDKPKNIVKYDAWKSKSNLKSVK